jgi:hypothetical protein
VPTGNLEIDYSGGTYVNEALNKIAEAAGVEWWMEGMTINISHAEHVAYGDDVNGIELGYNNGLFLVNPPYLAGKGGDQGFLIRSLKWRENL